MCVFTSDGIFTVHWIFMMKTCGFHLQPPQRNNSVKAPKTGGILQGKKTAIFVEVSQKKWGVPLCSPSVIHFERWDFPWHKPTTPATMFDHFCISPWRWKPHSHTPMIESNSQAVPALRPIRQHPHCWSIPWIRILAVPGSPWWLLLKKPRIPLRKIRLDA